MYGNQHSHLPSAEGILPTKFTMYSQKIKSIPIYDAICWGCRDKEMCKCTSNFKMQWEPLG